MKDLRRKKPVFAFLHWGKEYSSDPTEREENVSSWLRKSGVELVIGCHTHTPGGFIAGKDFSQAFSLGNFLFDQPHPPSGGNLLEVRFFPQGTYFVRLLPIGNLYGDKK